MFQIRSGLIVAVAFSVIISSTSASTYVPYDDARHASVQQRDKGHHRVKRQLDALTDAFSLEMVSQVK